MNIDAVPVTAKEFSLYGDVIVAPENYGRQAFPTGVAPTNRPVVLSTTHAAAAMPPITIEQLERHPFSSQTFIPMEVGRWLVVVSLTPLLTDIKAFVVGSGMGVTIGRGIWHYQLTPLHVAAKFAVFMWKDGIDDDEVVSIEKVTVHVAP
ncbi:MAG: ureidoglycolate lyase [Acidimicrobiales bacterium]